VPLAITQLFQSASLHPKTLLRKLCRFFYTFTAF